ncbi:MAG: flavoredoxin [Lentisphaerae bacterium GWF2_44_16]|nr:MAG: flavoredoxin [Lentisphaerae bacterium GWF2_44_16]
MPVSEKKHVKKSLGTVQVTPAPVWVIGSYDKNGRPNVMTAAWAGICCSNPPAVTVSLRKATYTYGNIMAKKAFTVNIPSVDYIKQTDYYGIASGKNTDKFQVTALTPVKSEFVDAPYVKQFPIVLECKLIHSYDIGLHTMFVGQIMDVKADEFILNKDGKIDMGKLNTFIFSPSNKKYYKTGEAIGSAFSIGKNYEDISKLMLQPKPNVLENNK